MTFQLFGDKNIKEKKKKEVREPAPKPSQKKEIAGDFLSGGKIISESALGSPVEGAMISRTAIIVDEDYLDFIRSKPCLIATGGMGRVDPDHLQARGTEEHKRNDHTALPFCRKHHSERGQSNEKFETKYVINLWQEAWRLGVEYLGMKRLYQLSLTNTLQTAAQVRKAQTEYFKSRSQDVLIEAQ